MAEVNVGGALVSSPREMEELYLQQQEEMMKRKAVQQQQEEMMKMKAVQQQQQQRLAYNKHMNFLLLQQNEAERYTFKITTFAFSMPYPCIACQDFQFRYVLVVKI
jgi:hypothetical protein